MSNPFDQFVKQAGHNIQKAGNAIGQGISDAGAAIQHQTKKTGKAIWKNMNDAGRAMQKGANDVGRAVQTGANEAGKAVSAGMKNAGHALQQGGKTIVRTLRSMDEAAGIEDTEKRQQCHAIIHTASTATATSNAALAQILGAGKAAEVPVQTQMIIQLGRVFGIQDNRSKVLGNSIAEDL